MNDVIIETEHCCFLSPYVITPSARLYSSYFPFKFRLIIKPSVHWFTVCIWATEKTRWETDCCPWRLVLLPVSWAKTPWPITCRSCDHLAESMTFSEDSFRAPQVRWMEMCTQPHLTCRLSNMWTIWTILSRLGLQTPRTSIRNWAAWTTNIPCVTSLRQRKTLHFSTAEPCLFSDPLEHRLPEVLTPRPGQLHIKVPPAHRMSVRVCFSTLNSKY